MGSGKGGVSTQQQQSQVSIPPEVLGRYNELWGRGESAANQPFQSYSGQFVAPINATQQTGIGQIMGANGAWQPAYGQAANSYGYASGNAQPFNAFAGALIPASINASAPIGGNEINRFMSPYVGDVVDSTTNWFNQQNAKQRTALNSDAISQGAFGGNRTGLAQAALAGQQNMTEAPTIAGLYNQGYSQALAAAQQQQGRSIDALQKGSGLAAQLGQNVFGQGITAGSAWQNLGDKAVNNQLTVGQAQLGAGTLEQQTSQATNQALYNQFLQQQAYPFQTTQFLSNLATGTGPLYGSTTTASGSSYQPQPFFSDDKLKEDVKTIGHTKDGLRIIRYKFKGDPEKLLRIGFLASDVEDKMPEAVTKHAGVRAVDYDRAARAEGGLVGYAQGGGPSGYNPQDMAQILAMAQQAMYPGAAGRPGIGGSGPRGMQISEGNHAQLVKPSDNIIRWSDKHPEPELKAMADDVNTMGKTADTVGQGYTSGKDALFGSAASTDKNGKWTPSTGGLIGQGGSLDWDKGWLGRNLPSFNWGSGSGSGSGSITTEPLPPVQQGGRIHRLHGGSSLSGDIPYDLGGGYIPDKDVHKDPAEILAQQEKLKGNGPMGAGGGGGGGGTGFGNLVGTANSIAGLASNVGKLGGMFGGLGGGAGDGVSAVGGAYSMGDAAGMADAAGGSGAFMDALSMLPMAAAHGGRAGLAGGGHTNEWMQIPGEILGAGVGSVFGGPIGGMAGGKAGKDAGLVIGDAIGGNWDGVGSDLESELGQALNPSSMMARGGRTGYQQGGSPLPPLAFEDGPPPYHLPSSPALSAEDPLRGAAPPPPPEPWSPVPEIPIRNLESPPPPREEKNYPGLVGSEAAEAAAARSRVTRPAKAHGVVPTPRPDEDTTSRIAAENPNTPLPGERGGPRPGTYPPPVAHAPSPPSSGGLIPSAQAANVPAAGGQGYGGPEPVGQNPAAPAPAPPPAPTPGSAADTPPPAAGLAPPNAPPPTTAPATQAAGFAPDQSQPKDWWDRNEKYIIPALGFLGNMLASPSRTFAGAFGAGLAGGAKSLAGQQEIGQGQQRIDIAQRGQNITMYNRLLEIANGQIINNGKIDPTLQAQIDHYAKLIGGGVGGLPTDGKSGGLAPSGDDGGGNWGRMITRESGGQQWRNGQPITSSAGAVGITQVMPGTGPEAARLAGLPWNPELFNRARTGDAAKDKETQDYNLALGKAYYQEQLRTFRDPNIASAAYNAGPQRVRDALAKAGPTGNYLDHLPKETQDYVRYVGGSGGGSNAPAGTGVQPVGTGVPPQDNSPASMRMPRPDPNDPVLKQMGDQYNPNEIMRRAKYIVGSPELVKSELARARSLQQEIENGIVRDANGSPLYMRSWGEAQQYRQRAQTNPVEMREFGQQANARRAAGESLRHIIDVVKVMEPNILNQFKTDVSRTMRGLGFEPPNTAQMNPDAYVTFVKEAAGIIAAQSLGHSTDQARQTMHDAFTRPDMTPGSVRQVLAQMQGAMDRDNEFYRELQKNVVASPGMNIGARNDEFEEAHPVRDYVDKNYRDIPVRGDLPKEFTNKNVDHAYIMTPQEMLDRMPAGSGVTLDRVREKFFNGTNEPRSFRIKEVNGTLRPVAQNG